MTLLRERSFVSPDLRDGRLVYSRFVNEYQRALVSEYEGWVRRAVAAAERSAQAGASATMTVNGMLGDFTGRMKLLGRRYLADAARLGARGPLAQHLSDPIVQRVVAEIIGRNSLWIDSSLAPAIRYDVATRLSGQLVTRSVVLDVLPELLAARTAQVASYAGGAVVTIFETQRQAGIQENVARRSVGEQPIPVRWVLDRNATHCADDPARATFGCPGLARVYLGGWSEMPTVPAGNVSCMGNCRCRIEADFGNGWEFTA